MGRRKRSAWVCPGDDVDKVAVKKKGSIVARRRPAKMRRSAVASRVFQIMSRNVAARTRRASWKPRRRVRNARVPRASLAGRKKRLTAAWTPHAKRIARQRRMAPRSGTGNRGGGGLRKKVGGGGLRKEVGGGGCLKTRRPATIPTRRTTRS